MELSKIKIIIAEQFRRQKGVAAVLVYGSYAKRLAKLNSDVDIAVLYRPDSIPNASEYAELKEFFVSWKIKFYREKIMINFEVIRMKINSIQNCIQHITETNQI